MTWQGRGRTLAVVVLYQIDLVGKAADDVIKEVRQAASDQPEGLYYVEPELREQALNFFEKLVRGTLREREALDQELSARLTHWSLDRLGAIERALLRLGCYELMYDPQVPRALVINEMIQLSKKFCDPKAKVLINGVLDAVTSPGSGR